MTQLKLSGTAHCKALAKEFLSQNAQKQRQILRKEIKNYVLDNWNIAEEFTEGKFSSAIGDLVNKRFIENTKNGEYVVTQQMINNATDLNMALMSILNKAFTDAEQLINSISFEPTETEEAKMKQISDSITELWYLKFRLLLPPEK